MNKVTYQIDKGIYFNGDKTYPPTSNSFHPILEKEGIKNYLVFDSFELAMFHLDYIGLDDAEYKCIDFLMDGEVFNSTLIVVGPCEPTKIPKFPPYYPNNDGELVAVFDPYFKHKNRLPLALLDPEKELSIEVER
jgi:hypothetical protein